MLTHARLAGLLVWMMATTIAVSAEPSNEALFSKLAALAEAGLVDAQYNLGMLYNNGIGTAQNPSIAFQWFERAANGGDPLGSYKVGCYYAGQFQGVVPPDSEKALVHKLVAAKAGYVRAQHDVAIAYAERGDHKEAAKWWQLAADQGDLTALAALADGYRKGVGVPSNPAKSYEYLLIASGMIPEGQARGIKPLLDEQRKAIDPDAATRAEKAAAVWTPRPTELTIRAGAGIAEARRIAQ
jgi:TPR repeat protein